MIVEDRENLREELYGMIGGECDSKIACHKCPYFHLEDCATRRAVDKVIESGWRPTK
jgi:hypothetical protein